MTTLIHAMDLHSALSFMGQHYDDDHKETGEVALRIEYGGDYAVRDIVSLRSPLTVYFENVRWLCENRHSLDDLCKTLSDTIPVMSFNFVHDELIFDLQASDRVGLTVNIGHVPYFRSAVFFDFTQLATRYSMVLLLVASSLGKRAGRVHYYFPNTRNDVTPPDSLGQSPYAGGRAPEGIIPHVDSLLTPGQGVKTLLEDLTMLIAYPEPPVGLRHRYARRVATPLLMAYKHLKVGQGKGRVLGAIKILRQCTDIALRTIATDWLVSHYKVTDEELHEGEIV